MEKIVIRMISLITRAFHSVETNPQVTDVGKKWTRIWWGWTFRILVFVLIYLV
jgi:hypothetical protein